MFTNMAFALRSEILGIITARHDDNPSIEVFTIIEDGEKGMSNPEGLVKSAKSPLAHFGCF